MTEKIRKRITFFGSVQGVGFRYRASHVANALRLTGWVHNEWDGTVSMEVQGREEEIDKMIEMIQEGTYISIEKIYVKQLPLDEHEGIFEIR